MAFLPSSYNKLKEELTDSGVALIAVSKTKPVEDIREAYAAGQLDFGENYVQELTAKHEALPGDIRWHFIGHLQTNKVKYIAPFVYMIHSVDSEKLLAEINRQGQKAGRAIRCLLQVHISQEETKFGLDESELSMIDTTKYPFAKVRGLMGMASFTEDKTRVRNEFKNLHRLHALFLALHPEAKMLSMGMSEDYRIAMEEGSNMIRVGSLLFGEREKK